MCSIETLLPSTGPFSLGQGKFPIVSVLGRVRASYVAKRRTVRHLPLIYSGCPRPGYPFEMALHQPREKLEDPNNYACPCLVKNLLIARTAVQHRPHMQAWMRSLRFLRQLIRLQDP